MENLLSTVSLTDIVGFLLLLASIWLIKIVLKRENEHILRGMMVFLLFLAFFLYLNQGSTEKWTLSDVKDRFFTGQPPDIEFRVETGVSGDRQFTRYIFRDPLPSISLSMGGAGDYFHIKDLEPVNRILRRLDLPPVKQGAPELVSVTGSRTDASIFRWNNYARGILVLEETLVQQRNSLKTYHGVVRITLRARY